MARRPDRHARPQRTTAQLRDRLTFLDRTETDRAEASLHTFTKLMWPAMEPARPFQDNWHLHAIAEHLQALETGQIKNLLINQPPATTKSILASVAFPSWIWTRKPEKRFMCLAYEQQLATRDAVRMRNVITSEEYQSRWPVELSDDQNLKTRYSTKAGGWRMSLGLNAGIVGEHPHGKIVDDPHNTKHAVLTEKEIQQAIEVFDFGLSVRGATLNAWTIVVMQRLHERDLSGHWMASAAPGAVVHLVIPMRYEPPVFVDLGAGRGKILRPRMPVTPLGFQDPRKEPDELLWPSEWPREKVDDYRFNKFGEWGDASQFQQRPSPAGGLLFKRDWFQMIETLPEHAPIQWVRYWDVAGTEGGDGPRTAGVKMGRMQEPNRPDGSPRWRFILAHIVKARLAPPGVDTLMQTTAKLDGRACLQREEVEPGSSGKAVVAARANTLTGFDYAGVPVSKAGNKVERANPLAVQAAAGNVYILIGPDGDVGQRKLMQEFLDEIVVFPVGALKDQADAAAGAFNVLTAEDVGDHGLLFSGENLAAVEDEVAKWEAILKGRSNTTTR